MSDTVRFIQTITLQFEDGVRASFSGPAITDADGRKVVGIEFSEPLPLPKDFYFGTLKQEVSDD